MKIAFDAKRLFNNHTGLGNYSRTLVKNVQHYYPENEYTLFSPNMENSQFVSDFKDYNIVDPKPRFSSYWRSFAISNDLAKEQYDIYHGLSNELPFSVSKIKAMKIVTIHDLFYERFPQDFSLLDREIYRKKTEFACRNADVVIAISEATKRDIIKYIGIPDSKIEVVYQSCNNIFQDNSEAIRPLGFKKIPVNYFLYVGSINKRKNLVGIIEALNMLKPGERIPLVVVGGGNAKFVMQIKERIKELKLEKEVFFLGNLKNEELKYLYTNARFTCLPSFYEGFGIPIIESLFCNTPVLSSKNSALAEAVGKCGLLIDPFELEQMSSSIHLLASNDSIYIKSKSHISDHLKLFSSNSTASVLLEIYNKR